MANDEKKVEETKTLTDADIVESPMETRRSALRVIGTMVLGSVVGAVVAHPGKAQAATDNDPNDAGGHGRTGRTDNDPNDAGGHGRRHGHRSGATDNDPNDGAGRGRGSGTGTSDSDPNDAGGRGRTGRTDNDPNDGAGRGRGH